MSLYVLSFLLAMAVQPRRDTPVDEEAALIVRIASADRGALRKLYDRLGGQAFAVALRVLGSRSEAEDALQESFLDVWTRSARFDRARGSGRTWVLSIVRNRAIDRLRTRGAIARMTEKVDAEGAVTIRMATPLEEVEVRADRERVQKALQQLTDEQRRTLELAYFEGLSQSEIAERLAEPLGTVKSRVRAAMDKLQSMLPFEGGRS
jgi:RNA polymerase sigma-70 factor (ECF subfamily)